MVCTISAGSRESRRLTSVFMSMNEIMPYLRQPAWRLLQILYLQQISLKFSDFNICLRRPARRHERLSTPILFAHDDIDVDIGFAWRAINGSLSGNHRDILPLYLSANFWGTLLIAAHHQRIIIKRVAVWIMLTYNRDRHVFITSIALSRDRRHLY